MGGSLTPGVPAPLSGRFPQLLPTPAHFGESLPVGGITREVVAFEGILGEVVEFLHPGLGGQPVDVFPTLAANRLGFGNAIGDEMMFVEEVTSPVLAGFRKEWGEGATLHALRGREPGVGENGGGEIDVEDQFGKRLRAFLPVAGVMNDEGDPDGFLMGEPLPGQAPFPEVESVVRGEDDQGFGVGLRIAFFELVEDARSDDR